MDNDEIYSKLNSKVLENIIHCGGDLNKLHNVDFFFYFTSEENAYRAAAQIQKDGFEVDVHPCESNSEWLCLANKQMLLELTELNKICNYFLKLAESFGGKFDGLGTPVE